MLILSIAAYQWDPYCKTSAFSLYLVITFGACEEPEKLGIFLHGRNFWPFCTGDIVPGSLAAGSMSAFRGRRRDLVRIIIGR